MSKKNLNIFFLFISKAIKIIRIKVGFIWPTLYSKFYLSLMGCQFGKNLKVCGKVYFRPGSIHAISLGHNVRLTARFLTNSVGLSNPIMIECIKNGQITIGNNTGFSSVIISSRNLITIGNNVNVGGNVRIFDHDFHSIDYRIRQNGNENNNIKSAPVVIEDDVFIGTNCIILKGVSIGARSIIAAGTVIAKKNIPPDSFVYGNPCVIKPLKLQLADD